MANDKHVALLKQGVDAWNAWRSKNPKIRPNLTGVNLAKAHFPNADLSRANLYQADLSGADFSAANLSKAVLVGTNLIEANLSRADLTGAFLRSAELAMANLSKANVSQGDLRFAKLSGADLSAANLSRAVLHGANLHDTNLSRADLTRADLVQASFLRVNLRGANLRGASLSAAALVDTDLTDADLTSCRIYGVSAWRLKLEGAKQQNLVITPGGEPEITVDNIEVAQFIYLLLHNPKIRDVIDTIGRKAVLILGRFTPERKAVLDALREELRKRDYVPILFDFDKPTSQDLTATVSTLAHLARFIIADLTDPSSIPYELATVVPTTPIPVQPILLSGCSVASSRCSRTCGGDIIGFCQPSAMTPRGN